MIGVEASGAWHGPLQPPRQTWSPWACDGTGAEGQLLPWIDPGVSGKNEDALAGVPGSSPAQTTSSPNDIARPMTATNRNMAAIMRLNSNLIVEKT